MKAIILAAGRGSRMGGLTEAQPKCLTRLCGQALLDWQLDSLRQGGISEIAVVTGYKGELLQRPGLQAFANPRWESTNMVMSLAAASEWLNTEPCLISYGDIVYAPQVVKALTQAEGELVISYDQDWLRLWQARFAEPLEDAESFQIDPQGHLRDIGRKVSDLNEIQGQYMGLLRFSPASWQSVASYLDSLEPLQRDRLDMTNLLRQLLAQGQTIKTLPIQGGWTEIDSESDLQAAQLLIAFQKSFAWLRQALAQRDQALRESLDHDRLTEATLALLFYNAAPNELGVVSSWKNHAWDLTDKLFEQGLIQDPKGKSKCITLTPEGLEQARQAAQKLFGDSERPDPAAEVAQPPPA